MDHRARLVSMGNRNEALSDTYGLEARTFKAIIYEEDNHPNSNILIHGVYDDVYGVQHVHLNACIQVYSHHHCILYSMYSMCAWYLSIYL